LDEKVTDYAGKLLALETQSATQHSTFAQELDGVRKMADLYKRHFDDAAARVETLEQALHESKEALVHQKQQLGDAARQETQAAREAMGREADSLRIRVAELETQLRESEQALALASASAAPTPATGAGPGSAQAVVAPTSFALGSSAADVGAAVRGGSAIQVYSRMAAAETALAAEKGD